MHHTEIQAIRQRHGVYSASSWQPAAGSFPLNCFLAASCLLPACPELVAGLLAGTSQPCTVKTIHPMLVRPRLQSTRWVDGATTSRW